MDQAKDLKVFMRCGRQRSMGMFATPSGEKREDVRCATIRAKKYRARAVENSRLADSALIQEVRERHQEVARHYLQLAETEKPCQKAISIRQSPPPDHHSCRTTPPMAPAVRCVR
jgi:hypothetical protein